MCVYQMYGFLSLSSSVCHYSAPCLFYHYRQCCLYIKVPLLFSTYFSTKEDSLCLSFLFIFDFSRTLYYIHHAKLFVVNGRYTKEFVNVIVHFILLLRCCCKVRFSGIYFCCSQHSHVTRQCEIFQWETRKNRGKPCARALGFECDWENWNCITMYGTSLDGVFFQGPQVLLHKSSIIVFHRR